MNDGAIEVNTWVQLSWLPAASRCITLTVDIDPEHDHAHYDLEIRDNASGALVALTVMPLRHTEDWEVDLQQILSRLTEGLRLLIEPF